MNAIISVLMPTHNRANVLRLSLPSFAELTTPRNWEIEMVVVANACNDETTKVLDENLGSLPFPARYVEEPDAGSSHARNRAIKEARGEILVFVDDDAMVKPQWLQALVDVFESEPADVVGGPVELWWHSVERPKWFKPDNDGVLAAVYHGDSVKELFSPYEVTTINTAYRSSVVDDIGHFRRDLERRGKGTGSCEDVDFNQRALSAGKRMFYAPKARVLHWVEPTRISMPALTKQVYFVGLSRVFAKPSMGSRVIVRAALGNLFLIWVHFIGEAFSRLTCNMSRAFEHRQKWAMGLGGIVGLIRRLAGKQSGYG